MALEACFQLSTIASTATSSTARASCLYSHREKISPQSRGSKGVHFSLSLARSSPFPLSFPSSQVRGHQVGFVCEAKNAVDGVIDVDDAGWDKAVAGSNDTLVLVDFWAPWCGPCRMIEPVINELARDYAGKLTCYKVNTDASPKIATKYGIRSIPTVLFFKDGEKKASVIGAVPKSELRDTIDKYLKI